MNFVFSLGAWKIIRSCPRTPEKFPLQFSGNSKTATRRDSNKTARLIWGGKRSLGGPGGDGPAA